MRCLFGEQWDLGDGMSTDEEVDNLKNCVDGKEDP